MTEPTQPTSSPPPTERPEPMHEVATEWGLIYATCSHPERVHFSTEWTVGGGESSLLINRIRYSCSLEFTRGEIPERRRSSYLRIDDTWHSGSNWYRLRRYRERGDATSNGHRVLREQLLPALASWLGSSVAVDLMERGTTYWQAECQRRANAAERRLSEAFQKVQDLRRAVAAGRLLTAEEEQFLRNPYLQPDPS